METDYKPGDEPLPVGTSVHYLGRLVYGKYEIVGHRDPKSHPDLPEESHLLEEAYPDGVSYDLWLLDTPKKFGNSHYAIYYARRKSLRLMDKEQS